MGTGAGQLPPHAATITVRTSPELDQLTMLRALSDTVTLNAALSAEETEDVRVALDEVATALICASVRDAPIECEFVTRPGQLSITVGAVAAAADAIGEETLPWQVLDTVTHSFATVAEPFDPERHGFPVTVGFVRTHEAGPADG